MNVWNFVGRLARDAEVKYIDTYAVAGFTTAVDSGYGDKKQTTWVKCEMWGKRGESVAPYLVKGTQVAVSGEVTNREYTDKDGNKSTSLELRVNDLTLVGGKSAEGSSRDEPERKNKKDAELDDDVPF